jgi:hypothetical protein
MEPERKIEKLLRAYAKKRRAQAGDPLKLHPAPRRILQGEIARNATKPDRAEASLSLWELFRQQWAVLAAFVLIVFFGASLFLPALSSAKKKAQNVTAMNNLKQIGLATQIAAEENDGKLPASLDVLTNQLVSDKILTDPDSGEKFIYVAGGKKWDDLSSNSVLAYSPENKNGRVVLFADGEVERLNDAQFSGLTNRRLPDLAITSDSAPRQLPETPAANKDEGGIVATIAPPISRQLQSEDNRNGLKVGDSQIATTSAGEVAANAPAAASDRLVTTQSSSEYYSTTQAKSVQYATAGSQNFVNGMQNIFKNTAAVAAVKSSAVLANFQVQQNGNAIRVVDADGSVYDGSLQPGSAVTQNISVQTAMAAPAGAESAQNERQKTFATRDELQTAQNYFFRVTGMNQTLKQNVVFAGNLLAIANVTTNLQQSFIGGFGGGQLQATLTNQLPWSSSRIAGTAVIAETNNIEINAVPLSP